MAQFGKNLFGASYFGYTNTLDGDYQTEIIDADELFDGKIDFKVKANLPSINYLGSDKQWDFLPNLNSWLKNGTNIYSTTKDSSANFHLSTDNIEIFFTKLAANGTCKIDIINPRDNSIIKTANFNTAENSNFKLEFPFQMVQVKITNLESKRIEITKMIARTTTFGIEVRASANKTVWSTYETVAMTFSPKSGLWEGSSKKYLQQQYVQAKVHLGTSDISYSPEIDTIEISSGDTSKRATDGWWNCALDLSVIAENQGKVFKAAKKIEYKKDCPETTLFNIRSTSTSFTFPNKNQIKDDNYWKSETVPYVFDKNTRTALGNPWSRIALSKDSNDAYVIGFEMSPQEFQLNNTKLIEWLTWNDQSYYPTDSSGTNITYKIYENKNDYEKGIPALMIIKNPERIVDRNLTLPAVFKNKNLFLFIEINRTVGKQTPAVDFVDLYGNVIYKSTNLEGLKATEISAIDNGNGIAKQEDFNSTRYEWPSNNQLLDENKEFLSNSNRSLTIQYSPLFPNQMEFYFNKKNKETKNRNKVSFKATTNYSDSVYSKVIADEPLASTQKADEKRITFHYAMDGGTVQYPKETKKELLTDFSPDLLKNVKYHFEIKNGWPDEFFYVPNPMTWQEIADFTAISLKEIKAANTNIKEVNGIIPQDVKINIPNKSLNPLINLKFESNNSSYSKKSIWNDLENDKIVSKIPSSQTFGYKEWTSEEKIYEGYMNPNNIRLPYIRNQKAVYSSNSEYEYIVKNKDTYDSIARTKSVNAIDLEKRNLSKELITGETIIIPASFSLPYISPEVIYENENPFIIELIPFSVKKEDEVLNENIITLGSDDESVLKYTYTESEPVMNELKRGAVKNDKDSLLYSNPKRIISIVDTKTGYIYQPYSISASNVETGDYLLKDGYVDWSPSHSLAKEPLAGAMYKVTYTYNTVDTLKITMTSEYIERSGFNKLWKSKEIKTIEGIASPEKDFVIELPKENTFQDFSNNLTDVKYLIEDNDLWVKTSIKEENKKKYMVASLNGENPKRNWYPEINTGFYYLGEQEYYMYSSMLEHNFDEEALPILRNVSYNSLGATLNKERQNLVDDSSLKTEKKHTIIF